VNNEPLKPGIIWHVKHFNKDPKLAKLEENTRAVKMGLWSQPNPVSPSVLCIDSLVPYLLYHFVPILDDFCCHSQALFWSLQTFGVPNPGLKHSI